MKIVSLFGIAGVAKHENSAAQRWAKGLEWPMAAVALWIVVQWYLEETQSMPSGWLRVADWLVWLAFFLETAVLTSLVADKRRYLAGNWLNLVIIIGGFPWFWQFAPLAGLLRSFRLAMVFFMLVRMSKSARKLLSKHSLGVTLVVALVTMVLSGIIISRIEPAIGSVWDGIWWAWVTMSTVGYGDVAPGSGAGRLFAALLILFGVVLLSLLTANFAAFFISDDVEKVEQVDAEIQRSLKDIAERLERIERKLEQRED